MIRLLLGGARSGKSARAQQLAAASGLPMTVVVTGEALDEEMADRIARHRADRPASWTTVEAPLDLAGALREAAGPGRCVIVDCLTLWISNWLTRGDAAGFAQARAALLALLPSLPGEILLVANETGLGVVPVNALARRFVDEAGWLNQQLARIAGEVELLVAGLPTLLKKAPAAIAAEAADGQWWEAPVSRLDEPARLAARQRQAVLTKPAGSLGRLEGITERLAAMQGQAIPAIRRPVVVVFAGDHGVVEEGVSAYPQAVTCQMLENFARGGAAINVLARAQGAAVEVVDVGTLATEEIPGIRFDKIAWGTANLARQPALSDAELRHALLAGRRAVERAGQRGADLFIGGEMGIGNTTAAAALGCALLGWNGAQMAGAGTGLDAAAVVRKAAVIDRALALHGPEIRHPLHALRDVSGHEIAALAGAYVACAQQGIPVLVDGFIATSAALAAVLLNPGTANWLIYGHASAEQGHVRLLKALGAVPILDLGMRLGEGSGAAMSLSTLRLALKLHDEMATFAEAGVSHKDA